jgi:hypothetical protein
MIYSRIACFALTITLGTLLGCGGGEPFSNVPVKGSVKYDDGSLIQAENLQVVFYPQTPPKDAKTHPKPGTAIVNVADGTFTNVTSHKPNDGIVVGEHKVVVQTLNKDHMVVNGILPPEYENADTTPLKYNTADKTDAVFTIPKKK